MHAGVQRIIRDLNRLYVSEPALHERDCEAHGFQWTVGDDRANSVFSFLRYAANHSPVLVVCNMTPVPRYGYRIGVPLGGAWREIFNSDSSFYGGSNLGNQGRVMAQEFGRAWPTIFGGNYIAAACNNLSPSRRLVDVIKLGPT